VTTLTSLATFEAVVDNSGAAVRLEALLPLGVRPRQLHVRTLLLGILLALADGRPAHLSRVHGALVALGDDERRRLGVVVEWKGGSHLLTYRQTERTFGLLRAVLDKETPDGEPTTALQRIVDDLIEASIPAEYKEASTAYAVDWTDVESFARPPLNVGAPTADPEASWGHRRGDGPGQKDELFYGNFLQLATMVREDGGAAVPELVRRLLLTSCHVDPPPAFVTVVEKMVASGVALGDVLADSGYAHRIAPHWALPLRALGADLVMDLHPHDRGTQGTHCGAICWNGNLYCPATPNALFTLEPLSRGASDAETASHDKRSAELAHYKLGRITTDDADGFHRVACPAVVGKVRCPRRAESMTLSYERPEILTAPKDPPTCCTQATLTVPPNVNAKTRQKHDYPSQAHRLSYGRRSAAERSNATVKDPASNDIARGWCRLMGLTSLTLMLTCLFVVRNQRVLASFEARVAEDQRRQALGLAPRTRRRRRQTISDLVAAAPAPP
jgi:hypothetical protein